MSVKYDIIILGQKKKAGRKGCIHTSSGFKKKEAMGLSACLSLPESLTSSDWESEKGKKSVESRGTEDISSKN